MRVFCTKSKTAIFSQRVFTAARSMGTSTTRSTLSDLEPQKTKYQLNPVQSTSLLVAYWRDLETRQQLHNERPPLIQDPTAQVLLDALLSPSQRKTYETSPIRPYGLECLAIRTRAMDDWLLAVSPPKNTNGTKKRQLVNLGAGMCSRPYRMAGFIENIHDTWFEVDLDLELLNVKRAVLEAAGYQPSLPIVDLSIDLSCPHTCLATELPKQSKGFSTSNVVTDWIAEGLLAYLKPSQHTKLLQATAALSMPGSRMALTVAEPAFLDFWSSLGASLPYEDLVPVEQVLDKAESFGWAVDQHIRPDDWARLYPGRGEHYLSPGYHVVFLVKE